MAELPCKDKAEKMFEAIEKYEECYDEVDNNQMLLSMGGALTVIECAGVLPAANSGSAAAFFKVLGTCSTSVSVSFTSFVLWLDQIDKCNELVFDALKIGKDWEKCSAKHKDVLNAAAAANAANS